MSETLSPFNPAEIKGMSVAYQSFLAEARGVASEKVVLLRADPILAYDNVKTACKGLLTEANLKLLKEKSVSEERIKRMQQAPEIAQAVIYAHLEAERIALREPAETSAKIARASFLRRAHLLLAESLVLFGLVKESEVKQIAEGSGSGIDLANDCTRLADLFTRNEAALLNKVPTNKELLGEMSKLGSELVGILRPSNSASSPNETSVSAKEAQEIRDRLWTLLDQCYDFMVSAGIDLVGRRNVKELVPPLQSRAITAKKKAGE
jgi:hypothetical protein